MTNLQSFERDLRMLGDSGPMMTSNKPPKNLKRTEKSVRMKLFFLDMISEDDAVRMDKIHRKDY